MAETQTAKPTNTAAPEKPKKILMVQAVYGRMVDPFTKITYDVVPQPLNVKNGWVDSQVEAGKLLIT
jgi:hypothetical protein